MCPRCVGRLKCKQRSVKTRGEGGGFSTGRLGGTKEYADYEGGGGVEEKEGRNPATTEKRVSRRIVASAKPQRENQKPRTKDLCLGGRIETYKDRVGNKHKGIETAPTKRVSARANVATDTK